MRPVARLLLVASLLAAATASARAQGLSNISVGLSANTPLGGLDSLVKYGFGFTVRTTLGDPASKWSGRGSLAFDYFTGERTYQSIQMFGVGADLVHRSTPNFYQFAGFLQASTKYARKLPSGATNLFQDQDFGFTGGVGVNFKVGEATKLFVEFAATTVFTRDGNSNWIPIRMGMKF